MQTFSFPFQPQIIVIGGGTAGIAAALSAKRAGASVLLVEEGNCLGGVSTQAGINEFYAHIQGTGSIFNEAWQTLKQINGVYGRYYNPEFLKMVWQLLANRENLDILFHTTLSDVIIEDGQVKALELVSASHKFKVPCQVCIDCSGEGDLAALAGAEFMKGNPENAYTLHMTLSATWCNTGKPVNVQLPEGIEPIRSADELPGLKGLVYLGDGRVYANMTKIMKHDPTDPISLSEAERLARMQLLQIAEYVNRTELPTWTLASSGASIGIREGRRIIGDFVLREDDVVAEDAHCDFPDGIAVATSQIDFHSLTRKGHVGWRQKVNPYAIPYRCCVPKGIKNMLMAGKCISLDQVVFSSYRMTPTVCMTGQSIGLAAAMSLQHNGDVRDIDIKALRARLEQQGLVLDPAKHQPFAPETTPDRDSRS